MTVREKNDRSHLAKDNARVMAELRRNGGIAGGSFAGSTLLILQTTGARTGQPRFTPLGYLTLGDRYYVMDGTAYYGATRRPDWTYNLLADPQVTIEVGTERFPAVARELNGEEREAVWSRFEARLPDFVQFARETNHTFPIFELIRTARDGAEPV